VREIPHGEDSTGVVGGETSLSGLVAPSNPPSLTPFVCPSVCNFLPKRVALTHRSIFPGSAPALRNTGPKSELGAGAMWKEELDFFLCFLQNLLLDCSSVLSVLLLMAFPSDGISVRFSERRGSGILDHVRI